MSWFFFALSGHIVNSGTFLVDRFVLKRTIFDPLVSVFSIAALSLFVIPFLFLPIGFPELPLGEISICLLSGITLMSALLLFFRAIVLSEASRIAPLTGSFVPIFTILMTYGFSDATLSGRELISFFFLVIGGIIISWEFGGISRISKGFPYALAAAFLFAFSYVLADIIYEKEPTAMGDIASFVWARAGGTFILPFFLISRSFRKRIRGARMDLGLRDSSLFILNRFLGVFSFILIHIAIAKGNVSLVNALQGVQYAFLIMLAFFAVLLVKDFPKEELRGVTLFQKVAAIVLISIGIFTLSR